MSRWIKVDVSILSKPAIRAAARDCACTIGDAFAAWFRLYSWLDEQTADGVMYTDRDEIDTVSRLLGFAASLERSGWLAFSGDTVIVSNWESHNGQNAKRRALDAKRKNLIREEMRRNGITPRPCPKFEIPQKAPVRIKSGRDVSALKADEIR